ncbi:MAG: hypothetical protein O2962_05815 [Cyanobacteria bacterium]|nr:hypothetical protein [Cyanobacteriota bacterium]
MSTITAILNELAQTNYKPGSEFAQVKTATDAWPKIKDSFSDDGQVINFDATSVRPSFEALSKMDSNLTTIMPKMPNAQHQYLPITLRNKLQTLLSNLVIKFKEQVLDKYFAAFFPNQTIKEQGVSTLVDDAFVDSITTGGLAAFVQSNDYPIYNHRFQQTQTALANANNSEAGLEYFKWLDINGVITQSMAEAQQVADSLHGEGFNKALVMGMGGSSQFPKVINDTFPQGGLGNNFKMEVMDGTDSASLKSKFKSLQIQANETKQLNNKTAFLIISKSGGTFEVKHVVQSILDHLTKLHHGDKEAALRQFAEQAVFVTEPGTGTLRKLADSILKKTGTKPKVVEHPDRVGGRFSFLTAVGMLPAALKGLKLDQFKAGSQAAIDEFFAEKDIQNSEVGKLALLDTLAARSGKFDAKFVASYTDRLAQAGRVKEQLAGESNSKGDEAKNNGVDALAIINTTGPLFQHSTIEGVGRNDKHRLVFEQVISKRDHDDMVHSNHDLPELEDVARTSLHQETITKLALPLAAHLRDNRKNPVVTTIMDDINEYNIGYLLMRDMLTTVVQAGLQDNIEDGSAQSDQTIPVNFVELGKEVPRTIRNNVQRSVYQDGVEAFKTGKNELTPESVRNFALSA